LPEVAIELRRFDAALPGLPRLRNIGEHVDDYATDNPGRHDPTITRRYIQAGSWTDSEWHWLGEVLDLDVAMRAAEALHQAVVTARPSRLGSGTTSG